MTGRQISERIGDRSYHLKDYKAKCGTTAKGLADAHEQVSDTYAAGTSDGVIDRGGVTDKTDEM